MKYYTTKPNSISHLERELKDRLEANTAVLSASIVAAKGMPKRQIRPCFATGWIDGTHSKEAGIGALTRAIRETVPARFPVYIGAANPKDKKRAQTLRRACRQKKIRVEELPDFLSHAHEQFVCLIVDEGAVLGKYFSCGQNKMPLRREIPSQAHRKLEEALSLMERRIEPHDTVVDLGAAPGGWTYIAWEAGAEVTAIDHAKLDEQLYAHPRITHLSEDAFKFEPQGIRYDWLICDMIVSPDQAIELWQKWVQQSWCRNFVITLKTGRTDPVGVLKKIDRFVRGYEKVQGCHCIQLEHNKDEITLFGRVL